MAGNPSKDVMRQPLPTGGDQSAPQDLMNQSFDPVFRTLIVQLMGRDASGTNLYPVSVGSDGSIAKPTVSERYDYSAPPIIYVGFAPLSSAESSNVWTIQKFDLTNSANAQGKTATNASWTSRAGATYN